MGHRLVIDGVDMSALYPNITYNVWYEIEDGGQGGLMLDGSDRDDELARWLCVNIPCYPLTEAQVADMYNRLWASKHTAKIYDPRLGEEREMTVKRQLPKLRYRGKGADGNDYWTGAAFILKEASGR